ncbi:dynein axonemal assembly factor 1 homolog [Bombus pyrosoma]|uniref:dynein axonemal assembly factor 1 homolog n=1 Tax=Bombus pyrosoma TaxID=396416 RepID=UPI001CB944DF|nr:dynein axonemal assembly factor 1 homolog [Bombus pyrosoma]
MQEECDFQVTLEKKLSVETRLDVVASSTNLSETEIRKSVPEDSSVDFEVLSTSSSDVLTKITLESLKNESTSDDQANKSTLESIPEVDNEDDSNWLSYFDCNAIFDVTCENLSYYNSTKAEKDSDSDMDDTLTFDDAEEGESMTLDENDSCCTKSYRQRSFEEVCEKKLDRLDQMTDNNHPTVVSDKISLIEINRERNIFKETHRDIANENDKNGNNIDCDSEDRTIDDRTKEANIEMEENQKHDFVHISNEELIEEANKMSDSSHFLSDWDDEDERNLVYSSPNVNISAYFKFRDSMKEPKFEATLEQPTSIFSNKGNKEPLLLEEIVGESTENDKKATTNEAEDQSTKEPKSEEDLVKSFTENVRSSQGQGTKFVELGSPEEYLEKLAEITEADCPRSEEEVQEKLKKIAEGKAKIENRKNEALKDLSVEFNEIEKLVAETKSIEQYNSESDESLDESKEEDGIEMPLTKDQVAESFKMKNTQKDMEDEVKRRAESLQECLQVIPRDPEEFIQDEIEGKAEVENRRNEIFKDLAMEFNEIGNLFVRAKNIESFNSQPNKNSNDDIEIPLIEDQVAESFKFTDSQNNVENVAEQCVGFLDECFQGIPKEGEAEESTEGEGSSKTEENVGNIEGEIEETLEDIVEEKLVGNFENISKEKVEQKLEDAMEEETIKKIIDEKIVQNLENIVEEESVQNVENITEEKIETDDAVDKSGTSKETAGDTKSTSETAIRGIVQDIIEDTEDSIFWQFYKQPERTYIKGKVYDFDPKKHGVRMTEEFLKKHCKMNKLYQTPHLNDVLYLHYKGFSFIENLEKYTGLRCLWLENNGIREIANLENQSELKCLYLHNNLINKIENLEWLTKLDTLNLSYNTIRRIENLDSLKFLNTLNLSHNYLQDTNDIEHLRLLDSLSVLDISHNRIDTDEVVNILGDMKELRVVSLMGNPILKKIRLYRKTMILKCRNLKYLDDRPVFPKDRACAEAWMRGGPEEEAAERKRWIEAEQKKINDSVQALINKRKLYKPVGTSEKEAEDKKKTKEDEEVATTTLVCTSDELLNLEKKKKSNGTSSSNSSSASSSSDEEVENAEVEDDGTGQKGIEKSDGRRPMAEEGRTASGDLGKEILLPWKTQATTRKQPKQLVEEIEETKEYVAGDAERKRFGTKILDDQRCSDDLPGGYSVGRELAHYEKLVLETTNETEITPPCCKREKNDDTEEKSFKDSSVCCNILEWPNGRNEKEENIVNNMKDKPLCKDILDNYRRKDEPHPLTSQLSSIREDMKEFCADVDKFIEDNKIVFKNGEVKRLWGEKEEINARIKSDRDNEEKGKDSSSKEKDFKWWNTKERKLKVKEILKSREEESKRSKNVKKIEIIEDVAEKISEASNKEETKENKEVSSSQGVYDLLNLKTCPTILLSNVKSYPRNEDASVLCESAKKEGNEDRSSGLFNSLFNEMEYRDSSNKREKMSKSVSSHELLTLEEAEEAVEETARSSSCTDIIFSDQENFQNKSVRIEITGTDPANATLLDDDEESESESVKTVINNYEKINEEGDTRTNIVKENNSECVSDSSSVTGVQNKMQQLDTTSDGPIISSSVEKSSQSSKSHKRSRDCEYLDVVSKKSHLIEEVDIEKDRSDERTTSEVFEKCRRHFMKEAKNFVKKESPLINQCIESLIANRNSEGNWKIQSSQEDFLNFTTVNLNPDFRCGKNSVNSEEKMISSREQSHVKPNSISSVQNLEDDRASTKKSDSCTDRRSEMASITQLLDQSRSSEKHSSNMCTDLYQEFCNHLDQMNSKRKLLIEPDFVKNSRAIGNEQTDDLLSSRETKQSKEEQTKPLIEEISGNSTNVDELEKLEELSVHLEDLGMDAAFKDKILKSISAPKTEEQRKRAKRSAERLMKTSREAMAKGKSLLERSSPVSNQKKDLDHSRRFFMNLLAEVLEENKHKDVDPTKSIDDKSESGSIAETVSDISKNTAVKIEEIARLSSIDNKRSQGVEILDTGIENVGRARKSLEMQMVQEN